MTLRIISRPGETETYETVKTDERLEGKNATEKNRSRAMAFGSVTVADYEVPVPINDSIQTLSWSPTSNLLVDGGWDNNVRLYH